VSDRVDAQRRAAFEQFFRETRTDLFAYALRRSADPADAADVLAETYLIAWEKMDSLPKGKRARLWLFGVARNVLLRGASGAGTRRLLKDRIATELRRVAGDQESVVDAELAEVLAAALGSLTIRDREIVMLTAWDGLTPKEIATVLGTSANAVRIRLHRARVQLKRELDSASSKLPSPGSIIVDDASI
jgi:RNA polymerase sigma factor (sigma-70 family)